MFLSEKQLVAKDIEFLSRPVNFTSNWIETNVDNSIRFVLKCAGMYIIALIYSPVKNHWCYECFYNGESIRHNERRFDFAEEAFNNACEFLFGELVTI